MICCVLHLEYETWDYLSYRLIILHAVNQPQYAVYTTFNIEMSTCKIKAATPEDNFSFLGAASHRT